MVLSWVLAQSYELVNERLEKQRLRHDFRRFVSRDLADALVANPQEWRHASMGVKRHVVVLFSDIRGFTNRAERADAQDLVRQLNEYLTAMVEIVFRHGGTLDKFIGDAIMAHWGALGGGSDEAHAAKALQAAQEMLAGVARLNEGWQPIGKEPFKIGIGVHLGEVIAGEIGSPQRTEFGVIGDAVNVASRLEGLSKPMAMELIFSKEVMLAAGMDPTTAVDLGEVSVKGRSAPISVFGISPTTDPTPPAPGVSPRISTSAP
jgi:adenylate cyclase